MSRLSFADCETKDDSRGCDCFDALGLLGLDRGRTTPANPYAIDDSLRVEYGSTPLVDSRLESLVSSWAVQVHICMTSSRRIESRECKA